MNILDKNLLALLPEVFLAGGAVVGLLLGSLLPRQRQWLVGLLAAAACLGGIAAAAAISVSASLSPATVFEGAFAVDTLTNATRIAVLSGALLIVVLALGSGPLRAAPRESEFYVLLQLAALGTLMLAGTQDLLLLAAAYLLAGIPSYALAGFAKDGPGTEAALKYYLMGAFLGILMLTGITALYAAGRGTLYPALRTALPEASTALVAAGVVALLAGLVFKAGAVPGHFWVPDAVQGSSRPAATFLATVPKLGALAALYRLGAAAVSGTGVHWAALLAVLATASMTLGNLAAFFQSDAKRLLAYSTVSQVGYLLMAVAVAGLSDLAQPALLFYLAAYAVTNVGAFAVVCALPENTGIQDYRGLVTRRPALAASLVVCLLGLVGTPPTAVFFGKLEVFSAAFDGGYAWLAVVAAANTVASLFYYLRWIVPAVSPRGTAPGAFAAGRIPRLVAYGSAVLSVALGVAAGPALAVLDGPLVR